MSDKVTRSNQRDELCVVLWVLWVLCCVCNKVRILEGKRQESEGKSEARNDRDCLMQCISIDFFCCGACVWCFLIRTNHVMLLAARGHVSSVLLARDCLACMSWSSGSSTLAGKSS